MTKPPWLPTWLPMATGMSSQRGAQPVAIERSAKLTPELYDLPLEKQKHGFCPSKWVWVNTHKYITIVGWTSIYQLFWGSLGTRVLTHPQVWKTRLIYPSRKKHACWFRIHDVHDGNPLVAHWVGQAWTQVDYSWLRKGLSMARRLGISECHSWNWQRKPVRLHWHIQSFQPFISIGFNW